MAISKWDKKPLNKLCHRIGDGLHGTPNYEDNSNIYFINGNNLKNGRIEITKTTNSVTKTEYEKNLIELNSNSLLLSINGTLGSMAFYNNEKIMLGKSAAYLNFKTDINKFYYYYFQLKDIQQYFYNVATGSTIKNLSLKSIQDFMVPVPAKSKWKKIVNILSSLDTKIELNNKINTELEAMAKTLYDYWFVQFDFPNDQGKPYKFSGGKMVYNEELKREIPQGWEDGELSQISNIIMGQSPTGTSYNMNGDGTIFFQGCTDFGNRFPTVRQFTTEPNRIANKGDILLSVRAPVGTINIAKEDCCIGRGLCALNHKNGCMPYLYGVMQYFKQIFDRRNTDGTTFGSITKDDLFSLKVVKPKDKVLEKFDKIANPMFEKQNNIGNENKKLAKLRDWLLPMLMNGQIRVE
jgi:type I restriction enzyme, S subunit